MDSASAGEEWPDIRQCANRMVLAVGPISIVRCSVLEVELSVLGPEGTLAACVKLGVVTQRRPKPSTKSASSRKATTSRGIRAATSKVRAKTSINFPRSVRGK
jgi:hypothetical protein